MNKTSPQSLLQALRWIKQTPNLFTPEFSPYFVDSSLPADFVLPDQYYPILQSLTDQLNQNNHVRLGIYYEYLWHLLLEQHPDTNLLAHNLPVRVTEHKIKKTLGEYDLIYQHEDQVYHRELAIKFYLGVPLEALLDSSALPHSPLNNWVGPGLKDRLDLKMKRMLEHQIVLSHYDEGARALLDIGVESVQKEILVQGRLFYPLNGYCPPPTHAHPDHLRGLWMTLSEFRLWHTQNTLDRFLMPEKPQWMTSTPEGVWHDSDDLCKELARIDNPQYVYGKSHHLFVVPDNWPEAAANIHTSI